MTKQKEDLNIRDMYGNQCILSKDDFLSKYNFNENGLSSQEAQEMIAKNGVNQVSQSKPKKWYNYFFDIFRFYLVFNKVIKMIHKKRLNRRLL